jgi:Protein of unknown function (DUF3781)
VLEVIMINYKDIILDKICYTKLVYGRVNKKLGLDLSKLEIEKIIFEIIQQTDRSAFQQRGKNVYITNIKRNICLTVNSYTNRLITVNKLDKSKNS